MTTKEQKAQDKFRYRLARYEQGYFHYYDGQKQIFKDTWYLKGWRSAKKTAAAYKGA